MTRSRGAALVVAVALLAGGFAPSEPQIADADTVAIRTVDLSLLVAPTDLLTAVTRIAGMTSAASVLHASTPALVDLPKLSPGVAGATRVRYFSIVGDSPGDLLDQTVAKSRKPCKAGDANALACVLFNTGDSRSITWIERTNGSTGACTVASVSVKRTSTVYLPQWVGPKKVRPALVTWWKTVLRHFAWHELQHIKIQKTHDARLRPLLLGQRCSAVPAIFARWARNVGVAQTKFDAKDASWQPDSVPYAGPWDG